MNANWPKPATSSSLLNKSLTLHEKNKINYKLRIYSSQEIDLSDDAIEIKTIDPLIVKGLGFKIFQSDLHSVVNCEKLNDNIINFYLNLLCNSIDSFKAFSIDSILINKILSTDLRGITKCFEKLNNSCYQLIFFPLFIHTNHWSLLIFNTSKKTISFDDSLFKIDLNFVKKITTKLSKYVTSLKSCSDWPVLSSFNYPQQIDNDTDWRVFLCQYAKYHAFNRSFDFTQSDILSKRIEIANEIRKFEINSILQHD
ncbi:unnamed protein product [Brachionus calyciflorus]|uniref:Ubiquitin-like protease family profile domain-containing protein n=1 Tax=Brachionus calyciflorus TaxID=104777 RepID=A0A814HGF7_9BILA|nr:unnamed protein product [Brachionus calyciflorus]